MRKLCSYSAILALGSVMVGILPASAQAREIVLRDADNGKTVTLQQGDELILRLESNPSTGYSWYMVLSPTSILKLSKHRYIAGRCPGGAVGCPGIEEFHFVPAGSASFEMGEWMRMLYLRPFDPGIEGATLWQVDVTMRR
ncbi:protease inhibitor I42 family protein [Polyangium mundeleinium]|uniref:Protease inhibitor I42 family protein n=1 Tax=Polyangium mundeleinium TaxID=2995306 RepID=A0ABT5EUE0_9BACT|nr:protease inhibitor I42 family protein [Polyangium mundeleinium]MDC0745444.1 protease inhibitor I42 family protein [Polyangium mundeleinium]